MEFEDITRKIIGCAFRVYNAMGFGFLESVYEKSLIIELNQAGLLINFGESKCEVKRKLRKLPATRS